MSTDVLKERLRVFVKEICDSLGHQPIVRRDWIMIKRQDDGSTSFPKEIRPDFSNALIRLSMEQLSNPSPAFSRCFDLVRSYPQLKGVLLVDAAGNTVDDDTGACYMLAARLVTFMGIYLDRTGEIKFDETVFTTCFEDLTRDIQVSYITVTDLTPLIHTDIQSDKLQIEAGVLLRQLRSNELEKWLNGDVYPLVQTHPLTSSELLSLRCAIEVEYQQPRFAAIGSKPEPYEQRQRLLTAIRLVTDASPQMAFTKSRTSGLSLFGFDSTSWGISYQRYGSSMKMDRNQEIQTVALYKRLGSGPNRDRIALALSRWNSAGDKLTDEDKLIDYWIALESLYVPETSQELSFRVALRIAAFLGLNGTERQTIYDEMRDSYRLRSEIVHGSMNKNKKKIPSAELIKVTRSYLRRTLLRIVESDKVFDPTKLESQLLANDAREKGGGGDFVTR